MTFQLLKKKQLSKNGLFGYFFVPVPTCMQFVFANLSMSLNNYEFRFAITLIVIFSRFRFME